jgi:hypothetical protein
MTIANQMRSSDVDANRRHHPKQAFPTCKASALAPVASGDGGFGSRAIAGGDFYAHWRPPADTSGSAPQFRGRRDPN